MPQTLPKVTEKEQTLINKKDQNTSDQKGQVKKPNCRNSWKQTINGGKRMAGCSEWGLKSLEARNKGVK